MQKSLNGLKKTGVMLAVHPDWFLAAAMGMMKKKVFETLCRIVEEAIDLYWK